MAKLFDLARGAVKRTAEAVRRVLQRRSVMQTIQQGPPKPPGPLIAPPIVPRPGSQSQPVPPPQASQPQPSQQVQPTPQEQRDIKEVQEVYTEVQLLGRDRGYSDEMQSVMAGMRLVKSSNVYGYYFEIEEGVKHSPSTSSVRNGKQLAAYSGANGILYVTFLGQTADGKRSNSAGATYAYYDVPVQKYGEFTHMADESAGKAVWDYLRVRGTSWEHQHRYRLIQTAGEYVPRKATKGGFKTRQLAPAGQPKIPNSTWSAISRLQSSQSPEIRQYAARMRQLLLQEQGMRRSTLAPRTLGAPNRARAKTGRPGRG